MKNAKFADYAAAYETRNIADADARKAAIVTTKAAIVALLQERNVKMTAEVFARFYAKA